MPEIIFISENPDKIAEYRAQMAQYGIEIDTMPWSADEETLDNDILRRLIAAEGGKKKAYALNEWSEVYNAGTHKKSSKTQDMEPVYNKGEMIVYWRGEDGALCKERKEHRVYGYIDLALEKEGGFGWDRLFVNAVTGKSYAESLPLWGKCKPRQLLISDFAQQYLFFKKYKNLNFGDYAPEETIAFVSLTAELEKNPLFGGNPHINDWGTGHFIRHAICDGIHLRFAKNRRENNYWMPGLNGGLPAVSKPDAVHETTYRIHDLTHYGLSSFCDLIPTGDFSGAAHRVYHAARMMSEAFSLVIADMLFVDSLKKSGIAYDYSQRNVHPLFARFINPADNMREIFKAVTRYALLGEDRDLRALMAPGDASDAVLANFKEWYGRFFSGDHLWTDKNFRNLSAQGALYKEWHDLLGPELFQRAKVTFLDDMVRRAEGRGADLDSYASIVDTLCDELLESHVLPRMSAAPKALTAAEEISHAFLRYMLGQSLFYVKYAELPRMRERALKMVRRLRETAFFDAREIADIRKEFERDVMLASGANVITHDDRAIFSQVFPIFPPVYIDAYDKQASDIAATVRAIFGEDKIHG